MSEHKSKSAKLAKKESGHNEVSDTQEESGGNYYEAV